MRRYHAHRTVNRGKYIRGVAYRNKEYNPRSYFYIFYILCIFSIHLITCFAHSLQLSVARALVTSPVIN